MNIKCKILGHKLKWLRNRLEPKGGGLSDVIAVAKCKRCGEIVERKVGDSYINEDHLRRLDEIIEKEEK